MLLLLSSITISVNASFVIIAVLTSSILSGDSGVNICFDERIVEGIIGEEGLFVDGNDDDMEAAVGN